MHIGMERCQAVICDHSQSEKLIAPTFTENDVLPLKDQSLYSVFQFVILNYSFNIAS